MARPLVTGPWHGASPIDSPCPKAGNAEVGELLPESGESHWMVAVFSDRSALRPVRTVASLGVKAQMVTATIQSATTTSAQRRQCFIGENATSHVSQRNGSA